MDLSTISDGTNIILPPKPNVRAVQKTCSKCSGTLILEDRKAYFEMDEGFGSDFL